MSLEHQGGKPRTAFEDGHIVEIQEPSFLFDGDGENINHEIEHKVNGSKLYGDYDYRLLARFLMQWIHQDGNSNPEGVKTRAYVVCFFLCPEIYGEPSATAMAEEAGVTRAAFDKWKLAFKDKFNFVLPSMKSEEARKTYSVKTESTKEKQAFSREFNRYKKAAQSTVLQLFTEFNNGAGI